MKSGMNMGKSAPVMSTRLGILVACSFFVLFVVGSAQAAASPKLPPVLIEKEGSYWNTIDGMEMVYIPSGISYKGSNTGSYDEQPQHLVLLRDFFIDKHEVTNIQFARFVEATGYTPQGPWQRGYAAGEEMHPVRFVTWYDAQAYAQWANKRLPTEAEWEKAARGRGKAIYPWGDEWKPEAFLASPAPVGSNPLDVSPYGCWDMGGNVWEWVSDWYDRYYYEAFSGNIAIDPQGLPDGAEPEGRFLQSGTAAGNERSSRKVIKSGGFLPNFAQDNMRVARRMWANPNYWLNDTGFRCVVSN